MTAPKHSGNLVAQLRRIIHKSQSQFAAMIGVSKHTIISVENGRNQLSQNLARRIHEATGANVDHAGATLNNYTLSDFDWWRKKFHPSNEETARKRFDEMKMWLKIIFLAAGKSGRAGNRDRLPAVCISLAEWMDDARKNFKLEDQIEDVLPDETRYINRSWHTISDYFDNPKGARKTLAEHGIEFNAIKKQLKPYESGGLLVIEDEYICTWGPSGHHEFVVPIRKLIPKAICWIRTFDPTRPIRGDELQATLNPREPHEKLLT